MLFVAFLTRPLSDEKMIIGLDEIFVISRVFQWRLRVDLARVTEKPVVVLFVFVCIRVNERLRDKSGRKNIPLILSNDVIVSAMAHYYY